MAFSKQKHFIYESHYGYQKWYVFWCINGLYSLDSGNFEFSRNFPLTFFRYNLTITNAGYDNLGDYLCVAENTGGVHEKKVTLTFEDPANFSRNYGLTPDQWTIVIGAVTAAMVFIAIIVALICCCCFCKKAKKAKTSEANKTKTAISAYGEQDQSHQRLLPPMNNTSHCEMMASPAGSHVGGGGNHHHGGYHHQYAGDVTEMTELRTPSVLSKPHSTSESSHSRHSIADNR